MAHSRIKNTGYCYLKTVTVSDIGTKTCGGYPGSQNNIERDAETFASWGVDMLKLDGCYASADIYETGYPNMSKALNATGRHIVYSCSWPAYIKNVSVSISIILTPVSCKGLNDGILYKWGTCCLVRVVEITSMWIGSGRQSLRLDIASVRHCGCSILQPNYTKIAKYCNLWRNYDDINDSWQSVLGIIEHYRSVEDDIQPFAGPGHWNDPDMVRN